MNVVNKKPDGYWTKERVLASAKPFSSLTEWRKLCSGARSAAIKNGWYEEATAHIPRLLGSKSWKWSKEAVLADAKKYQSKSEWRKSSYAYQMAHRQGWLDAACAHMDELWKARWTKEAVLADARKFQSRTLWEEASSGAYASAKRNGWYEEATAHMIFLVEPGKWTKEKILEEAKQYRTRGEWYRNSSSYSIAHINGWLDEACAHMITTYSYGEMVIYTFLLQHDIEFVHQKSFTNLKHINPLPFDFYLPNFNLLVEYHGIQHKRGWQGNKLNASEIQYRDALKQDYATNNNIRYLMIDCVKEEDIIQRLSQSITSIAIELNIPFQPVKRELTDIEQSLISNLGRWTKEAVLTSAHKYKTISEWRRGEEGAYNKALKMGWKEEAAAHMVSTHKPNGFWTKNRVIESAHPFNSQSAWKTACGGAWSKAVKMKWIAEATAHMKSMIKPSGYWTKENVIKSARKYASQAEWRGTEPSALSVAHKKGWIVEATAHMVKRGQKR